MSYLSLDYFGEPCQAHNIFSGLVAEISEEQKKFILADTNEDSGLQLIFIDLENGEGTSYRPPAGMGAWVMKQSNLGYKNLLYVGTYPHAELIVFDLYSKKFTNAIQIPNAVYIWDIALEFGNKIWAGTSPPANLYEIDTKTFQIQNCNVPYPSDVYCRYVSKSLNDGILCYFQPTCKPAIFHADTKTWETNLHETLMLCKRGVVWDGYFLARCWAFKGNPLTQVEFGIPHPPYTNPTTWEVDCDLTTDKTLFYRDGNKIWKYDAGTPDIQLVFDINLKGGVLYAGYENSLFGVRGQDYFTINNQAIVLKEIPIEPKPRPSLFLKSYKNEIWGGSPIGQTTFKVDVAAKSFQNTPVWTDEQGEIYDVEIPNETQVVGVSYSSGDLILYDLYEYWDQWNHSNPKVISTVGPKYIRPFAGIHKGIDGKLYSGWNAQYGKRGGAIAITDPATWQTTLMENPLGELSIFSMTLFNQFLYMGTSVHADGLPDTTVPIKFGAYDLSKKTMLYVREFSNSRRIWPMCTDIVGKCICFAVDGKPKVFKNYRLTFRETFCDPVYDVTSQSACCFGKKWYYGSGGLLVCMDLATWKSKIIMGLPKEINHVAVDGLGKLFIMCGTQLYSIDFAS